ncbi:hypothetical protein [Brevundimonas vesicularis]|uniref:HNH endonuclease n=1 Tax=Brevundimonas vesicularis TaxID=41276 RepID=A0ABU4KTS6_BREVE|nr:hypothetical protein [Brevundimonas vesicularis]MDX2336433.1 hypothetical protein [Brevundimonas vesicularis]
MTLLTRVFTGEPEPLVDWLEAFPADKRVEIERKPTIHAALKALAEKAAEDLNDEERAAYLACMQSQNRIPALFEPVELLSDPPINKAAFAKLVSDLFEIAFKALSPLGVRDRQYTRIYDAMPARICAFCGIEKMSPPDPQIPRESLDHYLSSAHYPFAAANMRNLAPAGHRCNSSHKLGKDVIRGLGGVRRRCFDPFGQAVATVSLQQSRPLEGRTKKMLVLPAWQIDLLGDRDFVKTWDEVYDIRTRYELEVLDAEFWSWLDHFANWSVLEAAPPTNGAELVGLIARYRRAVIGEGFADFLKIATFDMLAYQCQNGPASDRVTDWLIDLLSPGTGAASFAEDAFAA